jgi:hypothetical protein
MTLFEYVAVSFSIVLSFAVVRILAGISDVFARGRVYWVHAAWVGHQLLFTAYVWWVVWSYQEVSWTFVSFLAVLAGVSLVYYQATMLVPAQPTAVESWQEHFQAVRLQFFGAMVAWAALILINTFSILSVPAWHPARVGQITTLIIATVGLFSRRHEVHRVLVTVMLLLWPVRALLALAPGALAAR